MDSSTGSLDIQLVLLSDGAHHIPVGDIDEPTLHIAVAETLEDWAIASTSDLTLSAGEYDRLPECGISVFRDGQPLTQPGCCATLSGAAALRDFLLEPTPGSHTLFTGHDVMQFVAVRLEPSNTHVEIVTTGPKDEEMSFRLTSEQAKALAHELSSDIETLINRVALALPSDIASQDRRLVAEYLLGLDGQRYW